MHIQFCTGLRIGLRTSSPFSPLQNEGTLMIEWMGIGVPHWLSTHLWTRGTKMTHIILENDETKQIILSQKLQGGSQTAESATILSSDSDLQ